MFDQPMHLRLKKGMLVKLKDDWTLKCCTALVISDVYRLKEMFHMIDIFFKGKKRRVRTTWVREICN